MFNSTNACLFNENSQPLVLERLGEVDDFSAFWADGERCDNHVGLVFDQLTNHAVPVALRTVFML